MIDLNLFVPPGSNLTLTDVETINNGGEMFGIGTLANGNDRAFLLIPCDENHPNIEGCDYNMVDGNFTAVGASSTLFPQAQTAAKPTMPSDAIRRLMRSSGLRSTPWYRGLTAQPQK
jgi:hypothetical protein